MLWESVSLACANNKDPYQQVLKHAQWLLVYSTINYQLSMYIVQ